MRLIKSLGFILLTLAGVAASAQTFEVDGINYNVLSEAEGTVEVTRGDYSGDVVIPADVSHDGSTYRVTTIGGRAFYSCSALKSVDMPSVTTIGNSAFCKCRSLTSVSMPAVTAIGDGAFYICLALTSVSMPSVMTIGEEAFYYCYDLTSVSMPSVTTIGGGAFSGCSSLTSVFIPASCTSIGDNPFVRCIGLKEIVVDENNPNYLSADGALYDKGKTALIGWPTAEGDIDILPSVTTIGEYAFGGCDALTSVSMPEVTAIGGWAFDFCSALTSVEMPKVTTIGGAAFDVCPALTSVSMPEVTAIGTRAFFNCFALTSVEMPEVTAIGYGAFETCIALTSVDIPASVTMIGDYAFGSCSGLTSVYCHWEQPLECDPEFTSEVLMNATLYVPDGCADAYRSVYPWNKFANIEERDYSGIAGTPQSEVTVKVIDGVITVEGGDSTASAPVVEVYSTGGVCVWRGTDSSIGGLPRGVYVVKVDGTVQKVAL